ncbi:MAG: AAA family ATPase [Oscillospiraceae bacterium]|nr:AAA family ATPase [Oscillospiraceae bacterium]
MKILKLKFKNINSLLGVNEIDFTEPKFADSGIFAITGKTGAGKTSILDAVSLALFGKTPRVEITGKNNDVMSRGTSDCFAEIMFEINGKTWMSSWKQGRTRTGNFNPVNRQIASLDGAIVADQIRSCDSKIEEILGLTFEQFTKVIMLAQGSFAAFLQADKNEKGDLLEQITGTEIYGEISRKVFERAKTEREKLNKISVEIGAINLLSEEEIENLNSEIAAFETKKQEFDAEIQTIETSKRWLLDLSILQRQIAEAKTMSPELEHNVQTTKLDFEQEETMLKAAKAEAEKAEPILKYVRELDTKIAEKEKQLKPIFETINNLEKKKQNLLQTLKKQKEDLEKSQTTHKEKQELENLKWQLIEEKLNLASAIFNLDEQRKLLEEGKPCPLCGALQHPFAHKNEPKIDETEHLRTFAEYDVLTIEDLKKCLDDWNANKKNLEEQKEQIAKLEKELTITDSEKTNNQKQIEAKTIEGQNIKSEKQKLVSKRYDLFGDKRAENEEKRLKEQIKKTENDKANAENKKTDALTKFAENQAIIAEKTKELTDKQNKNITEETLETLQGKLDEKKSQSDEISQKIGANRQNLAINEINIKNIGKKLKDKEIQQNISVKWDNLNKLIGSESGIRYRDFAQALTFEHLIGLTNVQLSKMSERYILKRVGDGQTPFELSVIDKFQNCEERTAQNLSGGEKFIVSLSLALGLANMASKNMKIDTMFIDEGFGTLDSDYLDMALTALSNLQSEGKLIGVISHLTELKERIATHIEVTPIGEGYSKIVFN